MNMASCNQSRQGILQLVSYTVESVLTSIMWQAFDANKAATPQFTGLSAALQNLSSPFAPLCSTFVTS